jgi:hypothetical protein
MADNANVLLKENTKIVAANVKVWNKLEQQLQKNVDTQKLLLDSQKQINDNMKAATGVKELANAQKELAKNTKSLNSVQKQAKALTDEQLKAKIRLQEADKLRKKAIREEIQAENTSIGSKARLRQENKKLRQETDKLNLSTAEGQKRLNTLNKQIDANDKLLRKNSDSLTKQKINIGNYSSALSGISPAFSSAANGLKAMTSAAAAFIATPLGAVIGAIGLAVGALTAYFKRSEEGQNAFNKITKIGSVILENLLDIVSAVGKAIFEAFSDPQAAVESLWEAIKQRFINRLIGLKDTFLAFGDIIKAAFDLDFEGVKKAANEMGESVVQSVTGVDNALGKAKEAVTALIEETEKEIEVAAKLADMEAKRDLLQRRLIVDQEKLRTESRKLRLQAEQTEGQERIRLLQEAFAIEDDLAKRRTEIAKINLFIKEEENKLAESTKEDLDEQAQLEAELFKIQQDRFKLQRTLQTQINTELRKQPDVAREVSQSLIQIEKETTSELEEIDKQEFENWLSNEEKKTEKLREEEENRKSIRQSFTGEIERLGDELLQRQFDKSTEGIEQDLQKEREALEMKLADETLSNEQKESLQKQFDAKEAAAKTKKAQAEKKNNLFQIGIETAKGIAKAVAESPLTFGLPFSAFVAAQGAVNASLVASKPIPQFDKGTKSLPGLSMVAEKRPEFILNNGRAELINTPTVLGSEYKGAEVIGGAETARILENATRNELINGVIQHKNDAEIAMIAMAVDKAMARGSDKIVKAIEKNGRPIIKKTDHRVSASREKYSS